MMGTLEQMRETRKQWYSHFVAQMGSRDNQSPPSGTYEHWHSMKVLRKDYIELRKQWAAERTAAALAAAEAEVARLRAALVTTFGYANYMTRYYGINPHMLSGSFSDDLRNLMSIIGTALNPEATDENR